MSQVVAAIHGTFFCAWYAAQKHWLANNILGLAFCIQGIEMLSLGSFNTGAILLAGLFVHDIFWVFFTPVMVSVAKSFDAPIKLLFPSGMLARPFSMLGLGDIVIPGMSRMTLIGDFTWYFCSFGTAICDAWVLQPYNRFYLSRDLKRLAYNPTRQCT